MRNANLLHLLVTLRRQSCSKSNHRNEYDNLNLLCCYQPCFTYQSLDLKTHSFLSRFYFNRQCDIIIIIVIIIVTFYDHHMVSELDILNFDQSLLRTTLKHTKLIINSFISPTPTPTSLSHTPPSSTGFKPPMMEIP